MKWNPGKSLDNVIITNSDVLTSCNPETSDVHTTWDMAVDAAVGPQEATGVVLFTYDVIWTESDIHWASRWDVYLSMEGGIPASIHWYQILNSLLITVVLTGMIAAILVRNLKRDLMRYNAVPTDEEKAEEREEVRRPSPLTEAITFSNFSLPLAVRLEARPLRRLSPPHPAPDAPGRCHRHGRPGPRHEPRHYPLFCHRLHQPRLQGGAHHGLPHVLLPLRQVSRWSTTKDGADASSYDVEVTHTTAFLSQPRGLHDRKGLQDLQGEGETGAGRAVWSCSSRGRHDLLCDSLRSSQLWQRATVATALLYPGMFFGMFFILDIINWANDSTDAVPFTSMLVVIVLWFGISVPLVFLGSYFGYKGDSIEFPTAVSSIPRQIPEQSWFMNSGFVMIIGGILPFGALFVELFLILSSIWMEQYYYVFGFLLVVWIILLVTAAEISVLFCYFQLCAENYNWWWRSFLTSGAVAQYVFFYSIMYFQRLKVTTFAAYCLYFGYMGSLCVGLWLMTGAVGMLSCLKFNVLIYGSIKVD